MNEIVIGLLGGGVAVQLLNFFYTRKQSRRQLDSTALGAEVTALECAIRTLQDNLASSTAYYQGEIERLRGRIRDLEATVAELRGV
ncbi:MAG: hypothetical protein NC201_06795 [Prevotella sp.]|nr:hypothetical protein [Bacteroides sp.]MCM1366935.1 hypothetical protein [Prevotella sp.]MCM1437466.1 hypothetical protein [Prevotella sp.]